MARPSWDDPKAKTNKQFPNYDPDSLTQMGDSPVNVNDLNIEENFEPRIVEPDEVDIEDFEDSEALLMEGSSFEPESMYPHQFIRPKNREGGEIQPEEEEYG